MKTQKYYALLGDVVNSRKILRRKAFDIKLDEALSHVMQEYGNSFKVPVKKWKGIDEIAAVMDNPARVYEIIRDINEFIHPQKMRFAFAKGHVEMKQDEKDVSQLDGDAFHKASEIMGELKTSGDVFISTGNEEMKDLALCNQVNAVFLLKAKWTEKQLQIYRLYYSSANQEAVAKKFKISQQSVSKALKAIDAVKVIELEKKVIAWITSDYK